MPTDNGERDGPWRQGSANPDAWVSPWHFGLNQGPIILMIENYRTGLSWQLMRQCPYIVAGLQRAGFTGGWLPTHDYTHQ